MKAKQVLFFCNMAAMLILLLPGTLAAKGGKKDSSATATPGKRLVLSPQAYLQLTTEPIWGDSVEAIVTVAVPDSCKNQRYLCRIETNTALRFVTIPRYKWAVNADSLKILSAIPLQIRLARQNTGASAPVIKFHFQNVDHAANLSGTASLTILSEAIIRDAFPPEIDSILMAKPVVDSAKIATTASITAAVDSLATANEPNAFGIFYVALAIALIFMFGGMSWLMKWSQRRRFQSIGAKTTAMAFPHLQHLQPPPPSEPNAPQPLVAEGIANEPDSAEMATALETPSTLPAVIATVPQIDLALLLAQLQELKLTLQQIIAHQQEANQRLAQISAAAALEAPRASAQLALFDIINDETPVKNGERHANGKDSSALCAQSFRSANLAGELMPELAPKAGNPSRLISPSLKSSSGLRIFFAHSENKNETSEELLLH